MIHSQLKLFKRKKEWKTFDVVHNLDEYGVDINSAFQNWLARTNDYSIEDFISYVKSKDNNFICITKTRYDMLERQVNSEAVTEKIRSKVE